MVTFFLFVFADRIFSQVSLSKWATCYILSGRKESTSLLKLQEEWDRKGGGRKGGRKMWLQGGETEKVAEKVAAAEIIEKENPRDRGGEKKTGEE